jgi:hypothetical protein
MTGAPTMAMPGAVSPAAPGVGARAPLATSSNWATAEHLPEYYRPGGDPTATRAVMAAPPAALADPHGVPPGMPVVTTPGAFSANPQPVSAVVALAQAKGEGPSTHPVSFQSAEPVRQPVIVTNKPELKPVTGPLPLQPVSASSALPALLRTPSGLADGKDTRPGRPGEPLVRMVNTKRITLNFEIKDVGPSGLSGVELWYTQDCKEWKKYDAPPQAHSYVVEVDQEGMYGFTLRARSGLGLAKDPPAAGDQPQVWVVVDLTRPNVTLDDVSPSVAARTQTLAIHWKATDKNLGRHPINLYYAEKEEGPWKPIATSLENNGIYHWQMPSGAPARLLVRVEATDLAGNVGRAQSPKPVLLDMSRPTVSILGVEPNGGP